jgi:hypothetical protein
MHPALTTLRCPLLIGRDDLVELADRRLDAAISGRGHSLLLAGDAGIGKTRLLSAITSRAEARGFTAVAGSVAPQDRDVPAASLLDLARSMTRMRPFADLGRELLDLAEATRAAEHVQRRALVMGLVERILNALPGPTMLSFEDLQWTDEVSLEVIAELARQSRDRQILLTGDFRTEEVAPGSGLRGWRARLITQRVAEEICLEPLTEAETALMTTLILDTGLPAPREVAAAVFERTDGIPLHIEELLGALSPEARSDGKAIRQAIVPDTIEDAVMARLAQRSPEAQAAARAGAVIGRCFVPEVLAGIMDLSAEALEAPLQELVDHFVLDPPGVRGCSIFDISCFATLSTARSQARSVGDSMPGPPSSAPGSRERPRSTRPSTTSAPASAARHLRPRSPGPGRLLEFRPTRRRSSCTAALSPTSPTISPCWTELLCWRHMRSKQPRSRRTRSPKAPSARPAWRT